MKNKASGRLHIISLGCSKNLVDSEVMGGLASAAGFTLVDTVEAAETVLINTCGFINPAKEEAIEVILTLAEKKKHGVSPLRLIVAGCLAQRYGRKLLDDIPEVDLWIGTGEVGNIVGHLAATKRRAVITKPDFLMTARHARILSGNAFTAYLKIAEGCSNRCAYCTIPAMRGHARSRLPDDIIEEAIRLASQGVKEIILIAQDTTAYGRDLPEKPTLANLMERLAALKPLFWLRLLYTHPAHITSDVFEVMARHKKICRYLDLPIQHIDDPILQAMGRKVTAARIADILAEARRVLPDVAIRTSLITGFPGETPKRFERLLDFVRKARFDHLGVFTYSREEDTPAAQMRSHISEKEKERRRETIMSEQADISHAINATLIGSVQEVLLEEKSDRDGYAFIGRCRRQAPDIDGVTYIQSGRGKIGDIVPCVITGADHYDLFAKPVSTNIANKERQTYAGKTKSQTI